MTAIVRRLGHAAGIAANTRTRLYTVPAGKVTLLHSLHQSTNNGGTNLRSGTTVHGSGFIWDQIIADAFTPKITPLATVLYAGEVFDCEHNVADSFTTVHGIEFDIADAPQLHRQSFLGLQANVNQEYTVPAGKRFRIREVVLANHFDNMDVSVFVNGRGHIYKGHVKAGDAPVIQTDISVNAGEQVGARTTNPTLHVFMSGLLEDA